MEQVVESFVSIQRQINSLASVALQNRRALDLLTAEKGGTCLFLGEVCCYFVNETGIVQGRVKELRDRIQCCRKELQNLYTPQNLFQLALPWLLPFLGPLVLIILFLLLGPCLFNLFPRFLFSISHPMNMVWFLWLGKYWDVASLNWLLSQRWLQRTNIYHWADMYFKNLL